jgi:SAM-dependent methyltransferase
MTQPDAETPAARGHAHHIDQPDWSARAEELVTAAEATAPMVDRVLSWLTGRVPGIRDVLDIGCGPGVAACTVASTLPRVRVLAVDGAEPLLALARERAVRLGVGERLTTRLVELPDGLADLPQADLVWVSGVAHHLPDPVGSLRALGALVRPGGLLAVREGGLSPRFLPDGVAPGLLSRLEAAHEDLVAAGASPHGVVPRDRSWPDLFRAAGLTAAGSRSFLLDLPAPASPTVRRYLRRRLQLMREMAGPHIAPRDELALADLLDPDSPAGLAHRPDVFLLSVSTIHTARP